MKKKSIAKFDNNFITIRKWGKNFQGSKFEYYRKFKEKKTKSTTFTNNLITKGKMLLKQPLNMKSPCLLRAKETVIEITQDDICYNKYHNHKCKKKQPMLILLYSLV